MDTIGQCTCHSYKPNHNDGPDHQLNGDSDLTADACL